MGHNSVVSGHPKSTRIPRVDELSTGPPVLGCHTYSDHRFIDERVSPPFDDLDTVDLGTADQPRELRIGTTLSTDERDSLLRLLKSYLDVFAWSFEDMPDIDPSIVQHHLLLVPHARLVKQKLMRLHL